jgi:hypothetical protein
VTPEQQSCVLGLVIAPGRPAQKSPEDVLREFGATDGPALGADLLQDAAARRDPLEVELALVVCFTFGFSERHLAPLIELAFVDWHHAHEDVASALEDIGSPAAVRALRHLATWVPGYLEFDEARALATKAVWALGSIPADEARRALEDLATSGSEIVAEGANAQLRRPS